MKNAIERENFINKENSAVKEKKNNEMFTVHGWRDIDLQLPVLRIDEVYLMYRIENTRTFRQQLAYIAKHELPIDFFKNPESSEVQKAQEEILLEMINEKGSAFLNDLRDRGQSEPAIITNSGYLINGNRRTAALRLIGDKYIKCVVLPKETNSDDIYSLEQELQMAVDFREPYHWINELRNIYIGIYTKKINKDRMAQRLRLKTSELESKLRTKELVDQYLEWIRKKERYDYEKLDQAEEAFRQLEKGVKKYKDEHKNQELIYAVFHLIENPPDEGRLYNHVIGAIRYWNEIYKQISNEIKTKEENEFVKQTNDTIDESNEIIEEILSSTDGNDQTTVEIFSSQNPSKDIAQKIYDVTEDVKATKKEQGKAEQLYSGVSKALRELQSIRVTNESSNLEATKKKLEQIIKKANQLINNINDQNNDERH